MEEIFGKIGERIGSVFNERVEVASGVIEQAISLSENFLEQQERVHQETLEECEAHKAWIEQQCQELEQVQNDIEAILTQCAR